MKKVVFILLVTLGVLLLAALLLPLLLKDRLVQQVKKGINESVYARVDFRALSLSLLRQFPQASLCLEDLVVAGREPFDGDTLLYVKELRVAVNLPDLLQGNRLSIRSVALQQPRLHIVVLEDGRANYDIVVSDTTPSTAEAPPMTVQLRSYALKDASVIYDDRAQGFYLKLSGLQHTGRGDFSAQEFFLDTQSEAQSLYIRYGKVPFLSSVRLTWNAKLHVNNQTATYTFADNELRLNELPLRFDGWIAMPDDTIRMDLKWSVLRSEFRQFLSVLPGMYTRDFAEVQSSGSLEAHGFVRGAYAEEVLPAFSLLVRVQNGMFRYPTVPQAVTNIALDLAIHNANGQPDQTVIDLKRLHAEMGRDVIDARCRIATPVSDPHVEGFLSGTMHLSNAKNFLPLPQNTKLEGIIRSDLRMNMRYSHVEKQQFEKVDASGTLQAEQIRFEQAGQRPFLLQRMLLTATARRMELQQFAGSWGNSDVQASGSMENLLGYVFKKQPLKGSFRLMARQWDVNEWMAAEPTTTTADTSAMGTLVVPANIDFSLDMQAGRILYQQLTLEKVSGSVVMRNQEARLNNLTFQTLGGHVSMNGRYHTLDPKRPAFDYGLTVTDVDIQQAARAMPAMARLAPIANHCSGKVSCAVSVQGGLSEHMQPLLSELTAKGQLSSRSVTVRQLEVLHRMAEDLRFESLKQVSIPQLNFTFEIIRGRIFIRPFETQMNGLRTSISGSHGLDRSLDYEVVLIVPRNQLPAAAVSVFSQGLSKVAGGQAVPLPDPVRVKVFVGGTMDQPTIRTDFKQQAAQVVEVVAETVKEQVTQQLANVKEKVQEEVNRILSEAQKQADLIRAQAQQTADRIRREGYAQADRLVAEAKNPIAKAAAQEAAKKLKQETDKKAQAVLQEAEQQAQNILNEARKRTEQLLK